MKNYIIRKVLFLKNLYIIIFFIGVKATAYSQTIESYTTAGAYTWTCPAGVTSVQIECWGAGGGGGGATDTEGTANQKNAGGGAGGGYVKNTSYTVVAGTAYSIVVGAGGTAGANTGGNGGAGGPSYFKSISDVLAVGGNGGTGRTSNGNAIGGAKKTTGNIGYTGSYSYYGGCGGNGVDGSSGGGGGSAGSDADGNDAIGGTGGIAVLGGVAGPNGITGSGADGTTGNNFGGGASGARTYNTWSDRSGGVGGRGKVVLTYFISPIITVQPTANTVCPDYGRASFSVTATGTNITYKWQVSTDGGISYSDISNGNNYENVNTASVNLKNIPASYNGYLYRCVVTGVVGIPAVSNGVALTVNESACNGFFRSNVASGDWNATGSWQSHNGTAWVAASSAPLSTQNVSVVIRNSHSVSQNTTYTAGSSNYIIVESGATLRHTAAGNFNFSAMEISGTFKREVSNTTSGTITVKSGGIYEHAVNGQTVPTITWETGSTLKISGVTTTMPTATGSYKNVVWNCGSQSGVVTFDGNLNTIGGNFTVQSTGTSVLVMGNATDRIITVSGNISLEGGELAIAGAGTTGTNTLIASGSYTQSGGTLDLNRSASGYGVLKVSGAFDHSAGTITGSGGGNAVVELAGSSAQTLTTSGFTADKITLKANNASGITLAQATSVYKLDLTSGVITCNSNLLSVTSTSTSAITNSSPLSYVKGYLERKLATGGDYVFPVGENDYNLFILKSVTATGNPKIKVAVDDANNSATAGTGILVLNTNRYWHAQFTANKASFTSANVILYEDALRSNDVIGYCSTLSGTYNSMGGTVAGGSITSANALSNSNDDNYFNIGGDGNVVVPYVNPGNTVAVLHWTNPVCTYNEIIIVAKASTSVSSSPAGNGSAYSASLTYTSGTDFNGAGTDGYVVYKGSTSPITISGLTNGTTYYFKLFTRNGTKWSQGVEVSCTPSNAIQFYYVNDASTSGDIYCTAVGAAYDAVTQDGKTANKPVTKVQDIIDNYALSDQDIVYIDKGTYTETFSLTSVDEGSVSGYVKFLGAGYANTIFTAAAASNNVNITNADYVWIEGIKFTNSTTDKHNIYKHYGDYFNLKNCYLEITSTTASSGVNYYGKSNTDPAISSQYNTISGNIMTNTAENGIGIYFLGDNDLSTISSNTITLTGTSSMGMSCLYNTDGSNNYWPVKNTITDNTLTSVKRGISMYGGSTTNNPTDYNISGNSISLTSASGTDNSCIWMYYAGDFGGAGDAPINIYSNRLSGGYAGICIPDYVREINVYNNYICGNKYGLYAIDSDGNDSKSTTYHNSFYNLNTCVYFDGQSQRDWDLRNNILYTTGDNSNYCIYVDDESTNWQVDFSNYNLFYNPNNANIGKFAGATYTTLTDWKTSGFASSTDASSWNANPNYENPGSCDLDLVSDYKIGTNLSLSVDINGTLRSHPHVGAFEGESPLPVELISFTASCIDGYNLINWITSIEINNDYFTIERSYDAKEFEVVDIVKGAGKCNVIKKYEVIDLYPFKGNSYYRLKQTDFDGKYNYSDIISLNCNESVKTIKIENIITEGENISVLFNASQGEKVSVSLYNQNGQIIKSINTTTLNGLNIIEFDRNILSTGLYIIVLQSPNNIDSKKIVIE